MRVRVCVYQCVAAMTICNDAPSIETAPEFVSASSKSEYTYKHTHSHNKCPNQCLTVACCALQFLLLHGQRRRHERRQQLRLLQARPLRPHLQDRRPQRTVLYTLER